MILQIYQIFIDISKFIIHYFFTLAEIISIIQNHEI
jgi:hypothetical protein